MALSVSFSMLKLLAEELKATDYTLTQSSLDQVSEFNSAIQLFRGFSSILIFKCSSHLSYYFERAPGIEAVLSYSLNKNQCIIDRFGVLYL